MSTTDAMIRATHPRTSRGTRSSDRSAVDNTVEAPMTHRPIPLDSRTEPAVAPVIDPRSEGGNIS